MDKKEFLKKQIIQYENRIERNKFKRILLCIGIIAIVMFFIFSKLEKINTILDFLCVILVSIFGAGIYFYINMLIFLPLFIKSNEENATLEKMKEEYLKFEKISYSNENLKGEFYDE